MQTLQIRMPLIGILLIAFAGLSVVPAADCIAQDALLEAIEAAKSSVTEVPATEVERTHDAVMQATVVLQGYIEASDDETEWGWKDYLGWDDYITQLSSDEPDQSVLRAFYENLRRKHEGLELSRFTDLRAALRDYIQALSLTAHPDQPGLYRELLGQLAEALVAARKDPSPGAMSTLGRTLGTLEAAGQAPEVVSSIRKEFGRPNLLARISGDFITRNTKQTIEDSQPVTETILGTYQTGTATTKGEVALHLVPNQHVAELETRITAVTDSQNIGRRPVGKLGDVVITSDSRSHVQARTSILIDEWNVGHCPSSASATTCTTIHGVCAPRLISKLATRQVYRKKSQAEAIAAQRVARRFEAQFDERVDEQTAQANQNFENEAHVPLIRLDADYNEISFSSTSEALLMKVSQADPFQVSPSTEVPELDEESDASIVVHESAANNIAESVFGGKVITDRMAAEWLEVANQGDLPPEFKVARDNPWAITLARYRPLTVRFHDSVLEIRIRGSQFRRGVEKVSDLIEVSASYAIEKTERGVRFTRQGDVALEYPGKEQLTVEQTAVKSFLLEKFEVLFREQGETTGLQFPGRFAEKAPMNLSAFSMSGGWLTLAWDQVDEP